jgi:hypothetical protein
MFGVQKSRPVLFFVRIPFNISVICIPVGVVESSRFRRDHSRYLCDQGIVESSSHEDRLRKASTVAVLALFAEVCVGASNTVQPFVPPNHRRVNLDSKCHHLQTVLPVVWRYAQTLHTRGSTRGSIDFLLESV